MKASPMPKRKKMKGNEDERFSNHYLLNGLIHRADSVPQLIASDATELQTIVSLLCERGHTRIDINLGCPFPLQARKYRGAGILPYPDKVAALLTPLAGMQQIYFNAVGMGFP